MKGTRLLLVAGSLQRRSTNRAALDVVDAAATATGAMIDRFDGLAQIPAFDPDLAVASPAIDHWVQVVEAASAVIVATPEYAGGVPGTLKNAFDWLVGTGSMYQRPAAVISASTSGGRYALEAMIRTLTWQGAHVVAAATISAPRSKSDGSGRLVDAATRATLQRLTLDVLAAPSLPADEFVERVTATVRRHGIDPGHVAPRPSALRSITTRA